MRHSHNLITEILLEMALDESISSGIVDLSNSDHIELLAMNLFERGASQQMVAEVVNKIAIRDGQFPDRQAYNKDGWLVTFPSAEYKQAAIKKGTHFGSDPTNGQGGMNLYYKKRGKQKRQSQQDPSQVARPEVAPQEKPAQPQEPTTVPDQPTGDTPAGPETQEEPSKEPVSGKTDTASALPKSGEQEPTTATPEKTVDQTSDKPTRPTTNTPSGGAQPAPVTPSAVVAPQTSITQDFAKMKSWVSSPYGEWRDSTGTTVAVESLSGEVTPIKSTDREELKIFADKKKQDV